MPEVAGMKTVCALLCAAWLAAPFPASADVVSPAAAACNGKSAGDACDKGGSCKKSTCSKLDYSQGVPPRSKTYECLVCFLPAPGATAAKAAEPPTSVPDKKSSSSAAAPG